MTIRNRLLSLLLPPLIGFVTLISIFFYYNWQNEIISTFKERLSSTVVSIATVLPDDIVDKLKLGESPPAELLTEFSDIIENVGLNSLYIVQVLPVKKGDTVIQGLPPSDTNPIYDGKNPLYAFRQNYLLDVSANNPRNLGDQDFSESGEQMLYLTKRPMITNEYEEKTSKEHIITAYAPITQKDGHVIALLGADVSMQKVDQKLKTAGSIIILSALATISLVILCVYLSAHYISIPVQQVKSAALSLAAGEYGTTVNVKGPQEIEDLANTLNTMSECLMENIDRVKQSAAVRERLFGEYECALLLQERMFNKPLEEFKHPLIEVVGLQTHAAQEPHGVFVSIKEDDERSLSFKMLENTESGFESIYKLLENVQDNNSKYPYIHLKINEYRLLTYKNSQFPSPIIWQKNEMIFLTEEEGSIPLLPGAIIMVGSKMLWNIVEGKDNLEKEFKRVLTNFSNDTFEVLCSMLQQELTFLGDHHHLDKDIFVAVLSAK